jgi:predicted transcriptional regulator
MYRLNGNRFAVGNVRVLSAGNRSKHQLMYAILREVEDGIEKPTKIRYGVSISWSLLVKYLDYLVSGGFLNRRWSQSGKRRIYRLTGKGLEFLRAFEDLNEQILLIHE